jgi:hypothetical protein
MDLVQGTREDGTKNSGAADQPVFLEPRAKQ